MRHQLVPLALGALLCSGAATLVAEPIDIGLVQEVEVVGRTVPAVNFRRPGSVGTHLRFAGTPLAPRASGPIDVDAKEGYVQIQATALDLNPAARLGDEYMTYVLWAITPEGRATNLGEIVVDDDTHRARIEVTSELQSFGMIVTAEPHFAVSRPSDVVVLEAGTLPGTEGTVEPIEAKFELLRRGHYGFRGSSRADLEAPSAPFYVLQARNARRIAIDGGAMTYANDTFDKAQGLLDQAGASSSKDKDRIGFAKQAAQTFEDARMIAETKRQEEREAKAREDAESAKQQAMAARADAQDAQADAAAARLAADSADQARLQAEREKAELREKLRQQFALLFETRETARGLIVSMPNVLFDFNRAELRPEAREKLAKLSGIILTTPGLTLTVEGHADAIGSDEYNQQLSEKRAGAVRDYLVSNGVDGATVTAHGFGESQPIASNDTAEGRQQNRRVEIVVSGSVIGVGL
jgi:outer membrane protein OmpA-like peptidoglycan-associated protein